MGYAIIDCFATKEEAFIALKKEAIKENVPEDWFIIFYEPDYVGEDKPWSLNLQ